MPGGAASYADGVEDDLTDTVRRLRAGTGAALLGADADALVVRLHAAAFRLDPEDRLLVSTGAARAVLVLRWSRHVLLSAAGDDGGALSELADLVDTAVLLGGGRAEAGAAILCELVDGRPAAVNDLVVELYLLWRGGGERVVLDVTVVVARTAVRNLPVAYGPAEIVRSNVGGLLATAAVAVDDGELLDEAIALLDADGPLGSSTRLATLADALLKRHDRTNQEDDVDRALAAARAGVAAIPDDDPDPGFQRTVLGLALLAAGRHDDAVAALADAVAATAPEQPELVARTSDLGLAHSERYARNGAAADLDAAITAALGAVDAAGDAHPDRAALLVNLSHRLLRRHELGGDAADLDGALASATAAEAAARDAPTLRGALVALALARQRRFARTGRIADADAAIDLLEEALDAAEAGTDEHARIRSTLGIARRSRFEATGDRAELDRAVEDGAAAVDETRPGSPEHIRRSGQLAGTWQARFQYTSAASDAAAAEQAFTDVLRALPADHPDRFGYLVNRGLARLGSWQVLGDPDDLDAAVEDLDAAQSAAPGPLDRAAAASNLCGALRHGWEHHRDRALLARAVDAGRTAVALVPADDASRPGYLVNLAAALQEEFLRTGSAPVLDEALALAREAVHRLPAGHLDRAEALTNLGNTLRQRFDATGDARAAAAGVVAYRRAARSVTGPVAARLRGALGWGRLEMRRRAGRPDPRLRSADAAYEMASYLLPRLAWAGLERTDREHLLAGQTGLASDAAAVALAARRTGEAVTRLEEGRAVLFSQALAERDDPPELERIRAVAPELAERIETNRRRVRALGRP